MEKHKTGMLLHRHPKPIQFWKQEPTLQKKKDRILIKDLISYKLKYWTKEARLILNSEVYTLLQEITAPWN